MYIGASGNLRAEIRRVRLGPLRGVLSRYLNKGLYKAALKKVLTQGTVRYSIFCAR